MTEILGTESKLYGIASDAVVKSRREFYSSQKEATESIANWLWRTQECIQNCEFGALADFLLIDKFICELSCDEMQKFRNVETFSLEQLYETASEPQFHADNTCPESKILEIELNAVSSKDKHHIHDFYENIFFFNSGE